MFHLRLNLQRWQGRRKRMFDDVTFNFDHYTFPPELNLEGCCIQERSDSLVVITYNELTEAEEIWAYRFDADNLDGIWRKNGNRN